MNPLEYGDYVEKIRGLCGTELEDECLDLRQALDVQAEKVQTLRNLLQSNRRLLRQVAGELTKCEREKESLRAEMNGNEQLIEQLLEKGRQSRWKGLGYV